MQPLPISDPYAIDEGLEQLTMVFLVNLSLSWSVPDDAVSLLPPARALQEASSMMNNFTNYYHIC